MSKFFAIVFLPNRKSADISEERRRKHNEYKRIFCLVLVFIMIVSTGVASYAKEPNVKGQNHKNGQGQNDDNQGQNDKTQNNKTQNNAVSVEEDNVQEIEYLLDIRAELLNEEPVNISKLNDIDLQLSSLGVEFLSETQVRSQFPEAKADLSLALIGDTEVIQPRVCFLQALFGESCRPKMANVASPFWRMLHAPLVTFRHQ